MKKKAYRKNALLTLLLLVVIMVSVGSILYTKKIPDTRAVKTHASFTSQELFSQLQNPSSDRLDLYVEKALEVKGKIKRVNLHNNVYTITLNGFEDKRHILCEMQPDQKSILEDLKVGDHIVVKGILKGFLMDAILLNCIVLNEQPYE